MSGIRFVNYQAMLYFGLRKTSEVCTGLMLAKPGSSAWIASAA